MDKPHASTPSRGTIVYMGRFELPDRNAAAHRVTGNAKIFRDLGFRVLLLGVSRDLPVGSKLERAECHASGIEAWQTTYPESGRQWLNYIVSAQAFRDLLARARVNDLKMVVCYNHPAVAQVRAFALAHARGAAAVADVTEWYSSQRVRGARSAVKNADNFLRMHWANRCADGLIITSEFIAAHYRDTRAPMLSIPTLYPEQSAHQPAPRAPGQPPLLFFAGSGFTPAEVAADKTGLKDRIDWLVELLVEAMALGAEFRQVVYGLTREQFLAILPNHAGALERLGQRIDFRGRVPHRQLLDDLSAADFSIFFRKETRTTLAGFPSKLAEAITYGTPVITNPMPSTSAYIEDGRTGFLLDIHDHRGAAARLKEILGLPPEQIRTMKLECLSSHKFSHKNYLDPARAWLKAMPGPGLEPSPQPA